jgi:hypothetical protein
VTRIRALLVVAVGLASCDDRPRQWDAFVYPDFEGSQAFERIEGFRSLELCRKAATGRIQQLKEPGKAAYECGYRCAYNAGWKTHVCAKTET